MALRFAINASTTAALIAAGATIAPGPLPRPVAGWRALQSRSEGPDPASVAAGTFVAEL
ncbi:MAG TPA: hypothetical protein VFP38_03610 [Bradyrhizobium sp.]|nr:hypothetical protein [Bradyrhizobium sp.]